MAKGKKSEMGLIKLPTWRDLMFARAIHAWPDEISASLEFLETHSTDRTALWIWYWFHNFTDLFMTPGYVLHLLFLHSCHLLPHVGPAYCNAGNTLSLSAALKENVQEAYATCYYVTSPQSHYLLDCFVTYLLTRWLNCLSPFGGRFSLMMAIQGYGFLWLSLMYRQIYLRYLIRGGPS